MSMGARRNFRRGSEPQKAPFETKKAPHQRNCASAVLGGSEACSPEKILITIIIIYLYCRHTVHIHIKKMLNIYKNSNKNNNNIISQSKIVLINITLISTIAEWESEYKQ